MIQLKLLAKYYFQGTLKVQGMNFFNAYGNNLTKVIST